MTLSAGDSSSHNRVVLTLSSGIGGVDGGSMPINAGSAGSGAGGSISIESGSNSDSVSGSITAERL